MLNNRDTLGDHGKIRTHGFRQFRINGRAACDDEHAVQGRAEFIRKLGQLVVRISHATSQ